jgi:hypothetical protein
MAMGAPRTNVPSIIRSSRPVDSSSMIRNPGGFVFDGSVAGFLAGKFPSPALVLSLAPQVEPRQRASGRGRRRLATNSRRGSEFNGIISPSTGWAIGSVYSNMSAAAAPNEK